MEIAAAVESRLSTQNPHNELIHADVGDAAPTVRRTRFLSCCYAGRVSEEHLLQLFRPHYSRKFTYHTVVKNHHHRNNINRPKMGPYHFREQFLVGSDKALGFFPHFDYTF